jgi:hypothetical protein
MLIMNALLLWSIIHIVKYLTPKNSCKTMLYFDIPKDVWKHDEVHKPSSNPKKKDKHTPFLKFKGLLNQIYKILKKMLGPLKLHV